jgi:integrase
MKDGPKKKEFVPKHGSEGDIVLPKDVADLLADLRTQATHNLVFPTRTGRVNTKLLDQCKLVAGRAGLDEDLWKIKTFRSTFATSRLRAGYDLATLREQLRHKDQGSIEHYVDYLKGEELAATGKVDRGWEA